MQGIDYIRDRRVRWEAKRRSAATGSTAAPTLKGRRRGGGLTGTQDFLVGADVMEEAHLLPEMSPEAEREEEKYFVSQPLVFSLSTAMLSQNSAGTGGVGTQPSGSRLFVSQKQSKRRARKG